MLFRSVLLLRLRIRRNTAGPQHDGNNARYAAEYRFARSGAILRIATGSRLDRTGLAGSNKPKTVQPLSGRLACARTGCGRRIRTIEVRKVAFGITVYALLDFSVLFKTEVVVAESSSVVVLWGSENYPGALAAGDFHAGLVLVPLTLNAY